MFHVSFQDVSKQDLERLIQDEIPESLRLEYKRELNLDDRKDTAEAAKDVSAMANTVGGRILYGIDEKNLADGTEAASNICPLHDGTIEARLQNVLNSSIHPRPRFRTRQILIAAGGFVLLLETYPAYGGDLYMVEGFKESRFYKRGEKGTVLMTEPEIREAYARIAASRQALESTIENSIKSELQRVKALHQSVFVVPWHPRSNLVDPRQFGKDLGFQLGNDLLSDISMNGWRDTFCRQLRVVSRGYCAVAPEGRVKHAGRYALIDRSGVVHLANKLPEASDEAQLNPKWALEIMVATLVTAEYVLDKVAYWGPVRVLYQLRALASFNLQRHPRGPHFGRLIGSGTYDHVVPEANFAHLDSIQPILKELLDQLFWTGGKTSPRFVVGIGSGITWSPVRS